MSITGLTVKTHLASNVIFSQIKAICELLIINYLIIINA